MISISLDDVQVGVGHGKSPAGEEAMGIRFVDPSSGIVVQVTFAGKGLKDFMNQIKPPASFEVVQALPHDLKPA